MIQVPNSITITDKQREIVQNHEQDFPYTAMEARMELFPGKCTAWHWHDHFEVGIVKSGVLELYTQRGSVRIYPGQGYFLNSKTLHMNKAAQPEGCVCLHAQLFARELLAGTGLISRRYVVPVENCTGLEMLLLDERDDRAGEVIAELNSAFAAAESDTSGHELLVCAHLSLAWCKLFHLMEPVIRNEHGFSRENTARAKQMLSFIHENYQQQITISEIASAAMICERECFRCFSETLDTTPMKYLNRYRVATACRLLAETTDSISGIAEKCGFSNSSYFGKIFRNMIGCSPCEYRRNIS